MSENNTLRRVSKRIVVKLERERDLRLSEYATYVKTLKIEKRDELGSVSVERETSMAVEPSKVE